MIAVLPIKSGLGSSLDYSDVMGFWLGYDQMVWGWVMMVGETWCVLSKFSGRLCVNLWSCGCLSTLDPLSPLMN
jgi:hypothetical protein